MKSKECKLHKPNQLVGITSEKDISLFQRKMYNVFLKKVQDKVKYGEMKNEKFKSKGNYWFKLDIEETHKLAGITRKDREVMKNELDKLMGVIVTIRDEDNPTNWKEKFSILPRITQNENEYEILLVGTLVLALREQTFFTPLELMTMRKFKSKFSSIIFEYIMRYKHDNNKFIEIPKITIKRLREMTNTKNKYKRFVDFRKRVLNKSCKEIFEKANLKISYELEKSGRSYKYIKFHVKRVAEKLENIFSQEVLDLFDFLPEDEQVDSSKSKLKKYLDKYSKKRVKRAIEYCKKNNYFEFWKYFSKAIREDYEKELEEERLEKEKLKEEKKKKQKNKKLEMKKLNKIIQEKIESEVNKRIQSLTDEEIKSYKKTYDNYLNKVKKSAFENSFEKFLEVEIKSEVELEFSENLTFDF